MDLMCQNICSTDCIQNVLILLTAISLNFFHSAFDHSCYNFVRTKLYPSKSIQKGGEVLSLCPLCQQCFFFYIESFCIVGRKQATPLFPEYLSSLLPLTFLSDKKFRAITVM